MNARHNFLHCNCLAVSQQHTSMTVALMSSSSDLQRKRAQFIRFLDRALVMRHAQLLRAKRERIQSGQSPYFFKPRMDIWDDPGSPNINATLELPGLKKEEISLLIQDGSLVIWGERRCRYAPGAAANDKIPIQEVKYGKFRRVIPLPRGSQSNEISASIMDGMLTIAWPRYPSAYSTQHVATG